MRGTEAKTRGLGAYPLLMESKARSVFCFAVRLAGKTLRTFPDALFYQPP
jgi:hypothetical protein